MTARREFGGVRPLAQVVSWPARRSGGVAGELATANASRNAGRTASTAAALMIGLTLVTVVAVLGAGLRASVDRAVTDQVAAAYVLDAKHGAPIPAAEGEALARVDGVRTASHVRDVNALVKGEKQEVTGIDAATIGGFYRFDWTSGSSAALARLGDDGALVTKTYSEDAGVAIGDRLAMTTPSGETRRFVVRGIYDAPDIDALLGSISIPQQTFDAAFPQRMNWFTFIDAGPGAKPALQSAASAYNDATLSTGQDFGEDRTKVFASFLTMLYVLLAFSVIVSLFGMVYTLVLSIFERTRELGMLRAVGMSRRQARRMIRHESVFTALIGVALGLPLGVLLAAIVSREDGHAGEAGARQRRLGRAGCGNAAGIRRGASRSPDAACRRRPAITFDALP